MPTTSLYESVISRLLCESRLEDTKKRFPQASDRIDALAKVLPTRCQRFIGWAAKQLAADETLDINDVADALTTFDASIQRVKNRDIDSYKSLDELIAATPQDPSRTKQRKAEKKNVDEIYDSGRFRVFVPKTKEASMLWGTGTKWCIAAEENNQFNVYILFAVIAFIFDRMQTAMSPGYKLAVVHYMDENNEIKKTEYRNALDAEINENEISEYVGDEWRMISGLVKQYARKSGTGTMTVQKAEIAAKSDDKRVREYIAEHEITSAETLKELSDDDESDVRYMVAKNPHAPSEVVIQLSKDDDLGVVLGAVRNPMLPAERIEAIYKNNDDEEIDHGIAENPNTPGKILRQLALDYMDVDHYVDIVYMVARNPNTPPHTLAMLASSENRGVKFDVAANPHTPPNVLDRLSASWYHDWYMDLEVAKNPNASAETLERLSKHDNEHVRDAVMKNPNTPERVRERLASELIDDGR